MVLGLPRGGVPVAWEVARALSAPLDVFVVRKLGVPGHEELAMGAVASGGIRVLNPDVVEPLGIPGSAIEAVAAREMQEIGRRERAYRGSRPFPDLRDAIVIVVDDGIATGSTMLAAVRALRLLHPAAVVVASPVMSGSAEATLRQVADACVALATPEPFYGVAAWYADFTQTTDEEVQELLGFGGNQAVPAASGTPTPPESVVPHAVPC
jgi:predicted phosphoribosyltransferase